MGAATWTMACLLLAANAGPPETYYTNLRVFQIPVAIKAKDASRRANIKEFLLYVADPDGQHWQICGHIPPEKDAFRFNADDDRPYYFKIGVINAQTDKEEQGDQKCIVVDTVKPVLRPQSAERQGDDVVVRWVWEEKYPNWATFRLEYLSSDRPGAEWSAVRVAAPESGQASFHVDGPAVRVRMAMTDLARNESGWVEFPIRGGGMGSVAATGAGSAALPPLTGATETAAAPEADRGWSPAPPSGTVPTALTKVTGSAEVGTGAGPTNPSIVAAAGSEVAPPAPRVPRGPLPPAKMLKKRQITIDYEVTKYGPSGVKSVELYVTRDDGRTWLRCDGEDNINAPLPADAHGGPPSVKRSLTVELQADGLYGFYLVVKSGAGLGKPPPQNGIDVPQMRIEVDTTVPLAELREPTPHPTRRDCLILMWKASDNKFGPTPITLQWAERPEGEWHTIGGGELPNTGEYAGQVANVTGSYVWQVPSNIPAHVYLRLLARDMAGNESITQPTEPVLVDLNEPEVKPLQISGGPH